MKINALSLLPRGHALISMYVPLQKYQVERKQMCKENVPQVEPEESKSRDVKRSLCRQSGCEPMISRSSARAFQVT